ncbi:MAG: DNA repair protein RadC [Ignavibacteriae bacterium]|nr:DNA repair protein RadC [Ignavibacteriota bacterium]
MGKDGIASLHEPAPHHVKIKDWPLGERPREKLLQRGANALSDAELLAILIRVGSRRSTALDLARSILAQERTLRGIARKTPQELMRMKGIGQAKAVELLTAFEIGRRIQGEGAGERLIINSPDIVARFMIPRLREKQHESFWAILLDSKNGMIHEEALTIGTLNASLVHPREVFKVAIDHVAAAVIVVHNHPSGNPEPSAEDIGVTKQLVDAGKIIGIPLHDHIIIAGDSYTSFAERNLL